MAFEGVFWHVTDIHLNISYDYSNTKRYGDYQSDASFPLVQSALKEMKNIYPNPHFIIWNGDNAYHGISNKTNFFESVINVSKEIHLQFPFVNILPTLGNHDVNPSSRFNVSSKWCEQLFGWWKIFFSNASTTEIEAFQKGCYYTRSVQSKNETLKIIVLNTMLWYKPNILVKTLDDPLDQFSWLKGELQDAKDKKNKVFIVSHIPPGASEYSPRKYRFLHPKFNTRFLGILQKYADIIDAGFFGHQHIDAFKIIYDSKNKPGVPIFLSPSVSPFHLKGLGSINPSLRLYFWNNTNSESQYHQYHTSIPKKSENIKENSLNWSLEYISTSILPGLSAVHLHNFSLDLAAENSQYFDTFFKYHLSGRSHDIQQCLPNSSCRCRIVCGMQNVDYKNLDECLMKCPSEISAFWMIIGLVILILTLTIIGFVTSVGIIYHHKRHDAELTYRFTVEKL